MIGINFWNGFIIVFQCNNPYAIDIIRYGKHLAMETETLSQPSSEQFDLLTYFEIIDRRKVAYFLLGLVVLATGVIGSMLYYQGVKTACSCRDAVHLPGGVGHFDDRGGRPS